MKWKRFSMWAAFAAICVPLAVLIFLQFVWLSRLERMSALAHAAALGNFLDAVGEDVRDHYRDLADSNLTFPSYVFTEHRLDKAAWAWKKKPAPGAERLFLVDYTREQFGNFLVFDEKSGSLETPPGSDESLAMILATAPWQLASYRGATQLSEEPVVDERTPEYRIILRPVLDDSLKVVGVVGMVLDREWFRAKFFPEVVRKHVPEFFPGVAKDDIVVTVRDSRDKVLLRVGGTDDAMDAAATKLPYVFTDWSVGVHVRPTKSEKVAQTSFYLNLALSLVLGGAVVAGAIFAFGAASRAMNLSEMKADFVSNVSHELRTPVASIRVFGELLRAGRVVEPAKVREYGEYIETESRRLSRLVENILDFSRIESGRKEYRFAEARLEEVVDEVVRTFDVRLRDRGFTLAYEPPEEPLPEVRIDADAIGQALHNLIDNAVKYSGDEKTVTVRLQRRFDDAILEVEDRGIGIPADEQRRIFERFHRVGTRLVHDVKGSGLGLSITRHIVEAHRGSVRVESEPGRGSRFTIRLPLAAEDGGGGA